MKLLPKWYGKLNIFYKLIPFLVLYIMICLIFSEPELQRDEIRYVAFAQNLINGFYSSPRPNFNLWNGPGYPLLIASFLLLKLPLLSLRLLNALLLYFSLILCYKSISFYSSKKNAYIYAIVLGMYFPIYEMLPLIYTEVLTWFLISLVSYLLIKIFKQKNTSWKQIIITALAISYLAMVKIIFGYVILLMLLISLFIFLIPRFKFFAKKSISIFILSFIFCLPWLFYTYSITNRFLYWTNSGSMSLYTMSSPFPHELGDWSSKQELTKNPNHAYFMDSISKLNSLEIDDAYKKAAIANIQNHPKKFFFNWLANIGRLFFSYPFSNKEQDIKSFYTIIPNMFIVVCMAFTLVVSLVQHKKLPAGMIILLFFILIYLLDSTFVSAYRRMFYVTLPFWFLFFSYVFNNIISIKFRQSNN